MFIALMHSESRDLVALGETEDDALESIREKWNEEQRNMVQNGWLNSPTYYGSTKKLEEDYGVDLTEIEVGQCVVY